MQRLSRRPWPPDSNNLASVESEAVQTSFSAERRRQRIEDGLRARLGVSFDQSLMSNRRESGSLLQHNCRARNPG